MNHFTLIVNEQEMQLLKQIYQNHMEETDNHLLAFLATHNQTKILAYKSGKVLLQGNEITHELIALKQVLNRVDYEAIGSDEVGTGDVFGPIVICSCYVSAEQIPLLESLNVRDSKTINDRQVIAIAQKIAKILTHSLLILSPKKYNELSKKGYNLNKIKALLHNQALLKTTSKIDHDVPVILDQFCTPQLYFNYIKDETLIYRDIDFRVRAEQVHLSVAAAAIIARYAYLVKMQEYSRKIGFSLLKGAGKNVDTLIKEIYDQKGLAFLGLIAKMNYKNITKQNLI